MSVMPNAIPSSTSTAAVPPSLAASAVGPGGAMGRDEFLRLLTAQLRHQDPLNPMDGHQLAADLAQFSGLEQLLNIGATLERQAQQDAIMLDAINNSMAMGAIGRTVLAQSDQVVLTPDGAGRMQGSVTADIATAGSGRLVLVDASGREIASRALGQLSTGDEQVFDVGSAAAGLTAGAYRVRIEVTGTDGVAVAQQTYFRGVIDGLSASSAGVVLSSGTVQLPLGSIRRITG